LKSRHIEPVAREARCGIVPGVPAHPRTGSTAGEPAYCGYVSAAGGCVILTGADASSASRRVLGMSAVMKRRSRTRRVLKWIGTMVCVVLLLGGALSLWLKALLTSSANLADAYMHRQCFWLVGDAKSGRPCRPPRSTASLATYSAIFTAVAVPTALLWWRDRRYPAGHCQTRGYDLTGNVSGRCPECGTPVKAEGEAG
jgi:hypothetical protein